MTDENLKQVNSTAMSCAEMEIAAARLDRVLMFFQMVFDRKKEDVRLRIERVSNYALQKLFGDTIRLRVLQSIKRNKIVNDIAVERKFGDDWKTLDVIDEEAGGVVDVVSFLLRLVVMVLSHPQPRRLLLMDEPFKHVSAEYRPVIADLIKELAASLEIQFIIVTHAPELMEAGDVVYRLEDGALVDSQA